MLLLLFFLHQSTGQAKESADFQYSQPIMVTGQSLSHMSDYAPVHFMNAQQSLIIQ